MFVYYIGIPAAVFLTVRFFRFKQIPKENVDSFLNSLWNKDEYKRPGIIMHRGGAIETPENTLIGIQQAKKDGCCAVEIDLEFTKDGVGVLLHDDTVDRTSNGTGKVSDYTFQQLQTLDVAAKHPNSKKLGPHKVPTLEESLDLCLKLNLKIFIDCKGKAKETAELISRLYKEKPELYKTAVVCSFYPRVIYEVRKKDLAIMTALTYRARFVSSTSSDPGAPPRFTGIKQKTAYAADYVADFAHAFVLWYIFGNSFFLLNKDLISKEMMNRWEKNNVHVIAWTVNNPVEKDYLLKSLDCPIITDGVNSKH
ncbi:hypothetical protein LOTGIDRAFT_228958 [Lottia gigantea]|uniref:GP-PDE domain-containing protein n=1 Tax=Lottia gigantea TaxID=225164 RepID=V3ZXB6_LOTGI|nr:hypothetical protein LOTGIDRAFT_228958 [Lottia gigantea]ESO89017.1 hypothetical protein LOTGIDRAFT_228958 [Lottia gigantea]